MLVLTHKVNPWYVHFGHLIIGLILRNFSHISRFKLSWFRVNSYNELASKFPKWAPTCHTSYKLQDLSLSLLLCLSFFLVHFTGLYIPHGVWSYMGIAVKDDPMCQLPCYWPIQQMGISHDDHLPSALPGAQLWESSSDLSGHSRQDRSSLWPCWWPLV